MQNQLYKRQIKFKYFNIIILLGIIFLGSFLFLFRLSSNPPGLYIDEAGSAYNSFSILMTGKDEYGKAFPLAFKLFGSYTPPLFIYLNVPIIALLGLNVFSARFLSVLCGIASIFVYYLLLKELNIFKSKYTLFISTLFFAITPWLIFFSRIGYEQNLAFLFFITCVLILLKTVSNNKLFILSLPLISLATYTDYSQKIISPLLLIAFLLIFFKKINFKKHIRYISLGFIIACFIQIPNLFMATTPSFYTKSSYLLSNISADQIAKLHNYMPYQISAILVFTRDFLAKFITYLSPRSLFFLPDPDPQRSIPNLSVFYPWMVIPYLTGFYFLIKSKNTEIKIFLLSLLLISPITGALTADPFHIQRTYPLLLPISLLIALGIDKIILNKSRKFVFLTVLILLTISLTTFYRSYFNFLPNQRKYVWGIQYPQLAQYIKDHPNQTFVIDQTKRVKPQDIAYIQMAFYLKIPPQILQNDQDKDIARNYYYDKRFNFIHNFNNIEFRSIEWGETNYRKVVLVGDTVTISDNEIGLHNLTKVFEVIDSDGQVILRGFETNPRETK